MLLTFAILTGWFVYSAYPYRLPLFSEPVTPLISVLHVEKNGLSYYETRETIYGNGEFYIFRNQRKLFRYSFDIAVTSGVMPGSLLQQFTSVVPSVQPQSSKWATLHLPSSWTGEGWYTAVDRNRFAEFSTKNRNSPPGELKELFRSLERLPTRSPELWDTRDICLGFCYDPVAGLGITSSGERCGPES